MPSSTPFTDKAIGVIVLRHLANCTTPWDGTDLSELLSLLPSVAPSRVSAWLENHSFQTDPNGYVGVLFGQYFLTFSGISKEFGNPIVEYPQIICATLAATDSFVTAAKCAAACGSLTAKAGDDAIASTERSGFIAKTPDSAHYSLTSSGNDLVNFLIDPSSEWTTEKQINNLFHRTAPEFSGPWKQGVDIEDLRLLLLGREIQTSFQPHPPIFDISANVQLCLSAFTQRGWWEYSEPDDKYVITQKGRDCWAELKAWDKAKDQLQSRRS